MATPDNQHDDGGLRGMVDEGSAESRYRYGMFDALEESELVSDRAMVAETGLFAARRRAAEHLLAGPAEGVGTAEAVVEALMARDPSDRRWERLAPFEARWAALVLRLVGPVMDPVLGVADARRRGVTWVAIGEALGGVTATSAQGRFGKRLDAMQGR